MKNIFKTLFQVNYYSNRPAKDVTISSRQGSRGASPHISDMTWALRAAQR